MDHWSHNEKWPNSPEKLTGEASVCDMDPSGLYSYSNQTFTHLKLVFSSVFLAICVPRPAQGFFHLKGSLSSLLLLVWGLALGFSKAHRYSISVNICLNLLFDFNEFNDWANQNLILVGNSILLCCIIFESWQGRVAQHSVGYFWALNLCSAAYYQGGIMSLEFQFPQWITGTFTLFPVYFTQIWSLFRLASCNYSFFFSNKWKMMGSRTNNH